MRFRFSSRRQKSRRWLCLVACFSSTIDTMTFVLDKCSLHMPKKKCMDFQRDVFACSGSFLRRCSGQNHERGWKSVCLVVEYSCQSCATKNVNWHSFGTDTRVNKCKSVWCQPSWLWRHPWRCHGEKSANDVFRFRGSPALRHIVWNTVNEGCFSSTAPQNSTHRATNHGLFRRQCRRWWLGDSVAHLCDRLRQQTLPFGLLQLESLHRLFHPSTFHATNPR